MITLHTNYGDICLELDHENTPVTAENFLRLAKAGFYDGTLFHRVIPNFMLQGGGFATDMEPKDTHDNIENEADNAKKNTRGSIAMARTSAPHSASAQFFINVADNHFLNHSGKSDDAWGYCVFAQVTSGMDIADKISQVATGSSAGHQDVPVEEVIVNKVTIDEEVIVDKATIDE